MPEIINTKLILNPVNWGIVAAICLLGAYAAHSVLPYFTQQQAQG